MRILITRPRADAEALARQLHALGHATVIEPLIEIVVHEGADFDLRDVQALVFTSANGVRAAVRRTRERALPVLAVGPATAAHAREQGFAHVSESEGEGIDGLAHHVRAALRPADGALLHVTGSVTAGDLRASLAPHGFDVRTAHAYDAHAADSLSGALTAELTAGLIDAVMFFSPRTARLFAALTSAADLAPTCGRLTALALSPAVATALHSLPFRKVLIAARATTPAMLDLLKAA